jgi:small-conductance mechanosensitive channel
MFVRIERDVIAVADCKRMKSHSLLFSFLLLLLTAQAAADEPARTAAADKQTDATQVSPETWRSFENLFAAISQARQDLAALRHKLNAAKNDAQRQRIGNDIALLEANIDSLQLAWEMWATGGVDLQLFSPQKQEKFDWRREILSVFEPIVVEMRRLTERPRKVERLRAQQSFYHPRLAAAQAALANIEDYKAKAPSTDLKSAFGKLESRWRKRRDEIKNQLALINLQLQELQSPRQPAEERATKALKELLTGRFVNLVLAVLAASLVYGLLRLINRFYLRLVMKRGRRRPFLARVAHLSFMLISGVLALLAGMAVLYVRDDWILLGLLIIVLVGLALTLQRTLPAYIKEARVLLNIGPAREGERMIYNGLPWKLQSLNMYSTLVNPELSGGKLLLPLGELVNMVSRPYDEREPWFPTREGDFVVLADQTYGRVVLQTPEVVQLRVVGAVRSYPSAAFLDSHPRNLSLSGFAIIVKFGVDYRHQAEATTVVCRTLEDYLAARIKDSDFGRHLKDFFVEFDEAAASSLNFFMWAAFGAEAAESYGRIRRLLQRLAVEACNTHGWVIPFNQVTVHLAEEEEASSFDALPR